LEILTAEPQIVPVAPVVEPKEAKFSPEADSGVSRGISPIIPPDVYQDFPSLKRRKYGLKVTLVLPLVEQLALAYF
jgi:hypothetical protein